MNIIKSIKEGAGSAQFSKVSAEAAAAPLRGNDFFTQKCAPRESLWTQSVVAYAMLEAARTKSLSGGKRKRM